MRYVCFVFQAEDGIRDLVRSRGLGDVYKRQGLSVINDGKFQKTNLSIFCKKMFKNEWLIPLLYSCLLYTSDAADERSSVDLGGRRIIKKKNTLTISGLNR